MQEHLSLENINLLLKDELKDGNQASKTFRDFITQESWGYTNFKAWIDEAIEKGYHRHLQDLVVVLGNHLGLEIEFGHYQSSREDISFDGLWKKPGGEYIVLEVKTRGWIAHEIGQLGGYMDELRERREIPDEKLFGIYVLGGIQGDALADQIRGSAWRDRIRLISCDDLLKLFKLRDDLASLEIEDTDQKIRGILLPIDNINIGHLVNVIIEIAEFKRALAEAEDEEVEEPVSERAWTGEELAGFLGNRTSNQRALFEVLARQSGKISRKKLVEEMQSELDNPKFTGRSLAGTRAGITMRSDALNRERLIIESEQGLMYELRADYIGDVRKYFGM